MPPHLELTQILTSTPGQRLKHCLSVTLHTPCVICSGNHLWKHFLLCWNYLDPPPPLSPDLGVKLEEVQLCMIEYVLGSSGLQNHPDVQDPKEKNRAPPSRSSSELWKKKERQKWGRIQFISASSLSSRTSFQEKSKSLWWYLRRRSSGFGLVEANVKYRQWNQREELHSCNWGGLCF